MDGSNSRFSFSSLSSSDSSSVILFPHSSIRFYSESYRLSCREVQMRGRVSFSVKHDISRPFTVKGELSQVKVFGYLFHNR